MHCEDPGCLKACPAPGAIVQYTERHRRLHLRQLHRLRLLREGVPLQHPAHLAGRPARPTSARSVPTGWSVGQAPACAKACPTQAIYFGTKEDMIAHAGKSHHRPEVERGYARMPASTIRPGVERHACHVRAAACRQAVSSMLEPAGGTRTSARWSAVLEGRDEGRSSLFGDSAFAGALRPHALRHQGAQQGRPSMTRTKAKHEVAGDHR